MLLALTRVYSWGWGEGSGHCCCHHQLPRMNCPGDISEVRVHSCILGATQLPHQPGFSRQKWSSLCRTVCVLWRPNQILESHYYLIIWKKKFLDFFFVQFKPVNHILMSQNWIDRHVFWNFPCLRIFDLESSEPAGICFLGSLSQLESKKNHSCKTLSQFFQLWLYAYIYIHTYIYTYIYDEIYHLNHL